MSRRFRLGLLLAAASVLVTADQLVKLWAYSALAPGASLALRGPVDLTLLLNRSNAFGTAPDFGEATRWMLVAFNLAVASALAYLVWSRQQRWPAFLGCAFIVAGGIGNAVDRVWLGAVIDMFDASEVGFQWVFNLADVFVDIGIGLWLVDSFRPGPGPAQADASSHGPSR